VAVAQLTGTVVDESGGALPGVEVTVTQTGTGMTRFVITGAEGAYSFTNLPVGPYKLTAKLNGFSVFEQTGIVLAVGQTPSVNVTMKVAASARPSRSRPAPASSKPAASVSAPSSRRIRSSDCR
jgi:hypothetical protein